MLRRRFLPSLLVTAAAVLALAVPSSALAGNGDDVPDTGASPTDTIAEDVAQDGTVDWATDTTQTDAGDSPTTDTYSGGGGDDDLPPPADCTDTSSTDPSACEPPSECDPTDTSSTDPSACEPECTDDTTGGGDGGNDDGAGTPCEPVDECADEDTTNDAGCEPIEECSDEDTDGHDANGEECVPEIPDTDECEDDTTGGGNADGDNDDTVCGGGDVGCVDGVDADNDGVCDEEDEEVPGGGETPGTTDTAAGGGGPELPFTGLPLWWTLLAAGGLMTLGGGLWLTMRGRNEGA